MINPLESQTHWYVSAVLHVQVIAINDFCDNIVSLNTLITIWPNSLAPQLDIHV